MFEINAVFQNFTDSLLDESTENAQNKAKYLEMKVLIENELTIVALLDKSSELCAVREEILHIIRKAHNVSVLSLNGGTGMRSTKIK